jgi:transaldolase
MDKNRLLDLEAFGPSVRPDYLKRSTLDNGELQQLINQDRVSGLTSNPSIFGKGIVMDDHQRMSATDVFAAGDVAMFPHKTLGRFLLGCNMFFHFTQD